MIHYLYSLSLIFLCMQQIHGMHSTEQSEQQPFEIIENNLYIRDARTDVYRLYLLNTARPVRELVINLDKTIIISIARDKTIQLWRTAELLQQAQLQSTEPLCITSR